MPLTPTPGDVLLSATARAAIEDRGQLLLVLDRSLHIVAANAHADAAFGAPTGGLCGLHASVLMETKTRAGLLAEATALLEGAPTGASAPRARAMVGSRLDGTLIQGYLRAYRLAAPHEGMLGVRITNLSSEAALRAEFEPGDTLAAAVVRDVNVGIIVQSATGVAVTGNTAALRMLGLTEDDLMGRTSLDPRWGGIHLDGSEFPGGDHPPMRALRSGLPERDPMGVMRPDGTLGWFDVSATPLGLQPVPAVLVSFTEFTAAREGERSAALARRRLETMSSLSSEAQVVLDRDLRVNAVSAYAARLLGTRSSRLMGVAIADLVAAPMRASFTATLERTQQVPGGRGERDLSITLPDGRERVFACRFINLADDAAVGGILLNLHDIHELRAAQAALNAANAELERRLAQLSRERQVDHALIRIAELLRQCASVREAHDAVWGNVEQLFDDAQVALYLPSGRGGSMECHRCDPALSPVDASRCWGLRLRRTHVTHAGKPLRCEHVDPDRDRGVACVPLVVNGNIAALLVVTPRDGTGDGWTGDPSDLDRVAQRLGALMAASPWFG